MSLIFQKENVRIKAKAQNWEEAVRLAGNLLVEQGCANESYVDHIIESVKELGPYIVIAEGIAIPHTRPEFGALKVGCGLVTMETPVEFPGEEKPVKVLIPFSAVDNDGHIDIIRQVAEFCDRGLIDQIAEAKDFQEFQKVIDE